MKVNRRLLDLFFEDQSDRKLDLHPNLRERDDKRLKQVEVLIAEGALKSPKDYFHAATIFQHGDDLKHYWKAHELAKKAGDLGFQPAYWLAAASYDRWLMRQGKPQKYGTQYVWEEDHWSLWDIDPTTTDADRAKWFVPPLAQALQHAEEMTHFR